MNVYVMTSTIDCPAHWALRQEAVEHEVLINEGRFGYGVNFADVWDLGQPFVSLEHDIVPWPGAVQHLLECPHPRCSHRFPAAPPGNLPLGFGIGKYHPREPAPANWRTTEWRMLDGQVVPVLNTRLGAVHIHEPPVAHCRARTDDG
jgi:hypothetical protein